MILLVYAVYCYQMVCRLDQSPDQKLMDSCSTLLGNRLLPAVQDAGVWDVDWAVGRVRWSGPGPPAWSGSWSPHAQYYCLPELNDIFLI